MDLQIVHAHAMDSEQPAIAQRSRLGPRTENGTRVQVAAVCFRILSTGVEFLLVRTRRGRWTFPKGGVQAGLSHAQSAAIEAYEEGGVHGRIEEISFIRYSRRKFAADADAETHSIIHAHLCEVLRIEAPQEPNRDPTWFSPAKAKRRLAEGRSDDVSAELKRVVDRAVARIRRFPLQAMAASDALLKVRFEASQINVARLTKDISLATSSSGVRSRPPYRLSSGTKLKRSAKVVELRPGRINYI